MPPNQLPQDVAAIDGKKGEVEQGEEGASVLERC